MKNYLLFAILMAIAICHPNDHFREERMKRRKEFQKELTNCIVTSEGLSQNLKKQIEDNKDEDLRKILHLYLDKLDANDREIIRKCRREVFSKVSQFHKERMGGLGPHHPERPPEEKKF